MLAGLAAAVACSLGAATLPVGAAAAAQAAQAAAVISAAPASSGATAPPALLDAGRVSPGATTADRGRAAKASVDAAGGDLVAGTDQQALPVGIESPPAALRTVVVAVSGDRVPGGSVPAALGSRAPPSR
ncbi:hypothetical protein GA0070613_6055 [Micromonospora inositola]|uniref:Uncharacterized protein n=2 Tax=Micromonospora inositola TaxID=47865 RepID=A0A1C5K325_9ACTN|nr:hypothetical protein GA0070613_6055 [Micromonospora inositola]